MSDISEPQEVTGEVASIYVSDAIEQNPETAKNTGWIRNHKLSLAIGISVASAVVNAATDPFAETMHRLGEAAPWVVPGLAAGEAAWIGGAAMMLTAVGDRLDNPFTPQKIKQKMTNLGAAAQNNPVLETGAWTLSLSLARNYQIPYANPLIAIAGGAAMGFGLRHELLAPIESFKKRIPALAERANRSMVFKAGLLVNSASAVFQSAVLTTGIVTEMPVKSWGLLGVAVGDLWATIVVRRAIVRGMRRSQILKNS